MKFMRDWWRFDSKRISDPLLWIIEQEKTTNLRVDNIVGENAYLAKQSDTPVRLDYLSLFGFPNH